MEKNLLIFLRPEFYCNLIAEIVKFRPNARVFMNKLDFTINIPKHNVNNVDFKVVPVAQVKQPNKISTSSIARVSANVSEAGPCDWMIRMVKQILKLFGFSFSANSDLAEQLLDDHFQESLIVNANSAQFAIVVVMRYNNQYKVSFGSAREMKNSIDQTKTLLQQLFTHTSSSMQVSSENLFEINTMVIEKINNNSFNIWNVANSINFSNNERNGDAGSFVGSNQTRLCSIIESMIQERQCQQAISHFLIQF